MNKREDFKTVYSICLASIVVIAQTAVFAYIWYDYYRELIFEPFWRKGNWVLIAIYALINVLFSKTLWWIKGWLSEAYRCVLFYDAGNALYKYCDLFPDYTDQQMVPSAMADGGDDDCTVCDHSSVDLGFTIYIFQIVPGKETSGDLTETGIRVI